MELVRGVPEVRRTVAAVRRAGRSLGVVPTMGYLHAGHRALIEAAAQACDEVVVTIFVNPTQFGPQEDFNRYPRDLEADLAVCEAAGARWVFVPDTATMYPTGPDAPATRVVPPASLSEGLCGAFREGHFVGVATVVAKLFALWQPDRAYFGLKDFQQTAVVRALAADLMFPVQIVLVPTVREADGLAMSSRNVYLAPEARRQALALSRALQAGWEAAQLPGATPATVREAATLVLAQASEVEVQYLALVHEEALTPLVALSEPGVLAVAAVVAGTRLIDNVSLGGAAPLYGVLPCEAVS
ncbi:MAG: pantoate--beta-alanine ligase [Candidatus Sericytochromatia bacterium]|nr:pantoate--beta-alanine ligase [Candidatus Sericytochromatia bacterium]